jgi:hypothetical protein
MSESPLNAALRMFETTEANLVKAVMVLVEMEALIPAEISFGGPPVYGSDGTVLYPEQWAHFVWLPNAFKPFYIDTPDGWGIFEEVPYEHIRRGAAWTGLLHVRECESGRQAVELTGPTRWLSAMAAARTGIGDITGWTAGPDA